MTSREFCYWLQGWFEINNVEDAVQELTFEQVQTIKMHLALVFKHEIDPSYGNQAHVNELNAIHNGPAVPIHGPSSHLHEIKLRC